MRTSKQIRGPWRSRRSTCLMDRWGAGGKLVVGLAPANSCPASGLHAIRPVPGSGASSAYVCALINSTMFQDIASTIPPGNVRKEDVEKLGLPLRAADVAQLETHARHLASLVTEMVRQHSQRFPLLRAALRNDIALTDTPTEAWIPADGPAASSGPLPGLAWISTVDRHRARTTRLGDVMVTYASLLGLQVVATVRGDHARSAAVTIRVADSDHVRQVAEALSARLRGLAETGGIVGDISTIRLPVSQDALLQAEAADRSGLARIVADYRMNRAVIDGVLSR